MRNTAQREQLRSTASRTPRSSTWKCSNCGALRSADPRSAGDDGRSASPETMGLFRPRIGDGKDPLFSGAVSIPTHSKIFPRRQRMINGGQTTPLPAKAIIEK